MEYTKGEWGTAYHADGKYSVVVNPKGHPSICCLNETVPEAAANADLIAAAPDMYEVLKVAGTRIHNEIRYHPEAGDYRGMLQDELSQVTKALAKAEGK